MSIAGCGACVPDPDAAVHAGVRDHEIDLSLLAPMVRRRTSTATRVAISAATRACRDAGKGTDLPAIFVSAMGEIQATDRLCEAITAEDLPLSPTLFHNSVHNTAAGYWSIAAKSTAPMQAMAALNDCLQLGLMEAWAQLATGAGHVLLVCFDEDMPPALLPDHAWRPCAAALVLEPAAAGGPTLSIPPCQDETADTGCLSRLAEQNQTMACLKLIARLRSGGSGTHTVGIDPCDPNKVAELYLP